MTDTIMQAITSAVTAGRSGDTTGARRGLLAVWESIGAGGDPFHRCTMAHHLADLCAEPAEALAWDVRALDAADALTDARVRAHHADLRIAGFYPSLHLNLADDYRRLGAFEAAEEQIQAAKARVDGLADDVYGDLIRNAIDEVGEAVARRDATRRRGPQPPAMPHSRSAAAASAEGAAPTGACRRLHRNGTRTSRCAAPLRGDRSDCKVFRSPVPGPADKSPRACGAAFVRIGALGHFSPAARRSTARRCDR